MFRSAKNRSTLAGAVIGAAGALGLVIVLGLAAVAETAAVGTVVAEVEPNWFLALTRTRIAWPTSAEVSRNVWFVPPATLAHAPPYWSHLSHW